MSSVTATITSEGQSMDPSYEVLCIETHHTIDRIPWAELRLIDGDAAERKFGISDSPFFEPGRTVEIRLRYEGVEHSVDASVFRGPVVRQCVEADDSGSTLSIELRDPVLALTGPRRSRVFRKKSDDQAIAELLKQANVGKGSIPTTRPNHEELVQYHCSDWDFILSRADAQGLRAVVENGALSLARLDSGSAAKRAFEWGIDTIYDFQLEADASRQLGGTEAVAWSLEDRSITAAKAGTEPAGEQGNLDAKAIAGKLGRASQSLRHAVPLVPEELAAWADSRLLRQRLSLLRGRIAVPGTAELRLLDWIEVRGIGERWNGRAPITGLHHRFDTGGWQTHLELGDSPQGFHLRDEILDAPAAGLLPAVHGLQIGVVSAFVEDPGKQLRLEVEVPALGEKENRVWARLASPSAGKDRGFFFRPEPGDEVVLGFFGDDPRHPVVLGGLYSSKNAAPAPLAPPTADNRLEGIVSKKGTTLAFVDTDKASFYIETPKKNRLLLDDGEALLLEDQSGNSIRLSKDGVTIESSKDIQIKAKGSVTIEGTKVDVK